MHRYRRGLRQLVEVAGSPFAKSSVVFGFDLYTSHAVIAGWRLLSGHDRRECRNEGDTDEKTRNSHKNLLGLGSPGWPNVYPAVPVSECGWGEKGKLEDDTLDRPSARRYSKCNNLCKKRFNRRDGGEQGNRIWIVLKGHGFSRADFRANIAGFSRRGMY